MLSKAQVDQFWENGFVIAENGATVEQLNNLSEQLDEWIEQSRDHDINYGKTPDGKARFDLEAGHSAEQPRLRRVANPADISEAYYEVLIDGVIPDMVADLIGPDVKFHHCKVNIKLPGMQTSVDFHQDHPYDPHTNDDMVTAMLMLDEMTEENGCPLLVPGSHRKRYSHFQDGKFTGKVEPSLNAELEQNAVPITGKPGDVCLMHTWMVHGGPPNRSESPRRLLICDYPAADAMPLTPPMVPSIYSHKVIRGKPARVARMIKAELEIRPHYDEDSFFELQGQATAGKT
jgi:phytanoyl-CoA hydroxylase